MIVISPGITIDEKEIRESFIQASGPGGQHVNKNATAVQIQLELDKIEGLPEDAKTRLIRLAGKRINAEEVLTLSCQDHRSQYRNRREAINRLTSLIKKSTEKPKPRRATKPSKSSKVRRLEKKVQRGQTKATRKRVKWEE